MKRLSYLSLLGAAAASVLLASEAAGPPTVPAPGPAPAPVTGTLDGKRLAAGDKRILMAVRKLAADGKSLTATPRR